MRSLIVLRPGWLLLLLAVPAFYAAWRRWPPPLSPARARLALVLRVVMVVLLTLALADVRVAREPRHRAVVAVVDLSDSASGSQEQAARVVSELIAAKGPQDLFGVVTFGRDAQVEVPPNVHPTFANFQTRPDPSFSDLAGGLGLAAGLMPDGYARHVVLVSDGRENLGNASAAVDQLRTRGVRVDVAGLGTATGNEVLVASLEAPHELRAGQSLVATARLRATAPAEGRMILTLDGREVESRPVNLPTGASEQRFEVATPEPGQHRLRATLEASPDGYSRNDVAEAVVRVVDRPGVLLLEGRAGEGSNVVAALESAGMRVVSRLAGQSPTEAAGFAAFDSVVVAGAPADAFPAGALVALASSVRDLGRGLVAFGGPATYGPGGWQGTPLEDALPVRMEIPRPKERPAVAVAVVIETMEEAYGDLVALASIDALVDQLQPDDEVSVIGMDQAGPFFIVPLTRPSDKAMIKQRVRFAALGDPPGYADSLKVGFDAVAPSTAPNKHVVIVGDGDAQADLPRYDALFAGARDRGVVVSAIGVSTHDSRTDMDHMRAVAGLGGGRFFESDSAAQVPAVMLDASRSALKPWYEQAPFFPTVTSAGDLLDGVDLDAFPELGGYVATTPKPTADVVLASPKGDPVLAAGQHGLGRSVAWTSDAEGRWTAGLLRSPVSAALFGRMVAWSLPAGAGATGGLQVSAVPSGEGLEVAVSGPPGGGRLEVRLVSPDQAVSTTELRPLGPDRWQAVVPAPDVGTYLVHAALRRDGAVVAQAEAAVAVPYAPEYFELGRDEGLLAELAGKGGALLERPAAAWSLPSLPLAVTSPLFWLLLAVFAVAWPVDVALRRVTMSPRQLLASWREGRADRHRVAAEGEGEGEVEGEGDESMPAEAVSRLRAGMEAVRTRPQPPKPIGARPAAVARTPASEPEQALSSRLLEARRASGAGDDRDSA